MLIQTKREFKNHSDPQWNLDTGTGTREVGYVVEFKEPYPTTGLKPYVYVSLVGFDTWGGSHGRVEVSARNVSHSGFELVFKTWLDSRVFHATAEWMALPGQIVRAESLKPLT